MSPLGSRSPLLAADQPVIMGRLVVALLLLAAYLNSALGAEKRLKMNRIDLPAERRGVEGAPEALAEPEVGAGSLALWVEL